MVLAWIAVVAATVVLAPRLAGEFSTEFATAGSESQAAADLVAERFPGTSGDTIEVVWRSQGGADDPAILTRVGRFLGQAERLEGVA
jgi:putative drug exporter of the RND superfamily